MILTIKNFKSNPIDLGKAAECFCLVCGAKIEIIDAQRGILNVCQNTYDCIYGKNTGIKTHWRNGIKQIMPFNRFEMDVKGDPLEIDSVEMLRES